MHERLQLLLREYSLTSAKFADILGIQPSAISHLLSGRNKPSFDLLSKVLSNFPELNPRWLILGETPMYTKTNGNINSILGQESQEQELLTLGDNETSSKNGEEVSLPLNFERTDQEKKSSEISPENSFKLPDNPSQSSSRNIQTVIIFYTDGTFKSFSHG